MTPDTKELRDYDYEIRQEWTTIPVVSANFEMVVSPLKYQEGFGTNTQENKKHYNAVRAIYLAFWKYSPKCVYCKYLMSIQNPVV